MNRRTGYGAVEVEWGYRVQTWSVGASESVVGVLVVVVVVIVVVAAVIIPDWGVGGGVVARRARVVLMVQLKLSESEENRLECPKVGLTCGTATRGDDVDQHFRHIAHRDEWSRMSPRIMDKVEMSAHLPRLQWLHSKPSTLKRMD